MLYAIYSTRGWGLETNIALGFASCYIGLSTPPPRAVYCIQHSKPCFNYYIIIMLSTITNIVDQPLILVLLMSTRKATARGCAERCQLVPGRLFFSFLLSALSPHCLACVSWVSDLSRRLILNFEGSVGYSMHGSQHQSLGPPSKPLRMLHLGALLRNSSFLHQHLGACSGIPTRKIVFPRNLKC